MLIAVGASLLCSSGLARAEETNGSPPAAAHAPRPVHGLGHKLLFYVPNRLLDLADILRFRVRAGPGLAADARLTMYAANFIGSYNTLYLGLPGPRRAPVLPRLAGRESLQGLMVMGVDATDKTEHPPHYSDSELTLGAQALVLGLDLGLDPIEIGDFFAGWIMIDLTDDDL